LLVGESYWGKTTIPELLMKIAAHDMAPPSARWPGHPHMSPELDAWFLRSCDRDQAKRWPSVRDQVGALARALGVTMPTSSKPLELPGAKLPSVSEPPSGSAEDLVASSVAKLESAAKADSQAAEPTLTTRGLAADALPRIDAEEDHAPSSARPPRKIVTPL